MTEDHLKQFKLKDVFISHSWKDKKAFIEPLVAAFESAGITCWYDLMEINPGDSLVERINYGLTNSKVILLCISENFMEGKWSIEELETAIGLGTINKNTVRIIPLMLSEPAIIIKKYPLPFSKIVYIRWTDNLDYIVNELRKVISDIEGVGKEYWIDQTKLAYKQGNYIKSALYAKKSLEYDNKDYPSSIYFIASMLQLGRNMDVFRFIYQKEEEWANIANDKIEKDILDYAQDRVSELVVGNEIDETGFTFAIVEFLFSKHNSQKAWQYQIRLYSKKEFDFHRPEIVGNAAFMGKEKTLNWLSEIVMASRDERVKESLVTMLSVFAYKIPKVRDRVLNILRILIDDEHEDIRSAALIPYYYFANNGSQIVIKALDDRSPMVRGQAFELLSGAHNIKVTKDWEVEESKERKSNPLLTPDLIKKLLNDPEDLIIEEVIDKIAEGKIVCPDGVDLENLSRPTSDDVREAQVKFVAMKDTKKNLDKLLNFALNDPSEFVRSEAITKLEESKWPIPSKKLRRLYSKETVSDVKDELESLVLAKGNRDLADIYYLIFEKSISLYQLNETAIENIIKSGESKIIRKALLLCKENDQFALAAKQLSEIINKGHIHEAAEIIKWCLENEEELENAVLAAGVIKNIPFDLIRKYHNHENMVVRVNSYRAAENRLRNKESITELKSLYIDLKPKVQNQDKEALWATLSIVDGIFEFESREEAIVLLREYYKISLKQKPEGSFAMRAAWERLRIMGVILPNKKYQKSEPTIPYPWPDRRGSFFRKIDGKMRY